jgi:lipopolysaccharide/colanic/teichoic acid biosynthesis glycosyltransferase
MYLETSPPPVRKTPQNQERSECRATPSSVADDYVITPGNWWYLPVKTVVEFVLAGLLLILTSPIVLLAGIFIKLTSRGPMIYHQTRVGKDGRLFTIYKLRTMLHNCEALTGPQWATSNDTRVTPIGRFLRATHIDEFPQLWNVLRGEMSLVGPRPERPEFVEELQKLISKYENRLAIRPGITGLAQVNLAPDTDIASVRRKLMHDLYYMQHWGLWLDLRLLVCTFFAGLGAPSLMVRTIHRVLFMPTHERICEIYDTAVAEPTALTQWEPA